MGRVKKPSMSMEWLLRLGVRFEPIFSTLLFFFKSQSIMMSRGHTLAVRFKIGALTSHSGWHLLADSNDKTTQGFGL